VIFCYLSFSVGYHVDDAGLTDTRSTDESDICEELKFYLEFEILSWFSHETEIRILED